MEKDLVLFELDGSAFVWHFPQQSENGNFMSNCIFCDALGKIKLLQNEPNAAEERTVYYSGRNVM